MALSNEHVRRDTQHSACAQRVLFCEFHCHALHFHPPHVQSCSRLVWHSVIPETRAPHPVYSRACAFLGRVYAVQSARCLLECDSLHRGLVMACGDMRLAQTSRRHATRRKMPLRGTGSWPEE